MSSYYPARFFTRNTQSTINNRGRPRSQRHDPMLQSYAPTEISFRGPLSHTTIHGHASTSKYTHTPVERSLMYGLHIDRVRDRA